MNREPAARRRDADAMNGPSHVGHGGMVPSVIVVDPRFDAYVSLAASASEGRLSLHLRSSGSEALRLARRLRVDAWIVAENLDDMSGHDFVTLLQRVDEGRAGRVAMVGGQPREGGRGRFDAEGEARGAAAALLEPPISLADLASLLAVPAERRSTLLGRSSPLRGFVTVPVGIGAAVIAVAVLMMG